MRSRFRTKEFVPLAKRWSMAVPLWCRVFAHGGVFLA